MRDDAADNTGEKPHYQTSAADKAHGTHGKGDSREQLVNDSPVEPGNAGNPESAAESRAYRTGQEGNLADSAWGNAAAGGSVIDKRPPENK
jgi:hypothetical protein